MVQVFKKLWERFKHSLLTLISGSQFCFNDFQFWVLNLAFWKVVERSETLNTASYLPFQRFPILSFEWWVLNLNGKFFYKFFEKLWNGLKL